MPAASPAEWNARYEEGTLPWDSGRPSRELARVLDEAGIDSRRAVEFGCGTGTNAVWLARRGFEVTAIDVSERAVELARGRAAAAGVELDLHVADATAWSPVGPPFDLVFDRGCYHCVRSVDVYGYLSTLRRVTRRGSILIVLTGNADAPQSPGPPTVDVERLGRELGPMFEFEHVRRFHFEDADGAEGPLGWSVLARRR